MNLIWLLLILLALSYCLVTNQVEAVNTVLLEVGKETFDFVIPLLCAMAFWNGILYVAKEAGILHFLEQMFHPFLKRLFPDLREDKETLGLIATNIVVNMVGLGTAATPAGLKAMEGMQKHNPNKDTASRSMITFLVLNTAGVTLFSTTLIALRASFHSQNVTGFMPYAILATTFASLIGLLVDRWWNYRK